MFTRTGLARVMRVISSTLLALLTLIGGASATIWLGNIAGQVQPLVVVSGSMSPGIAVGDLLIDTPTPVAELSVGEVATIASPSTGVLVTHRIAEIERRSDAVVIRMKGDANRVPDAEDYVLDPDARVWQPTIHVSGIGVAVTALANPFVSVPLIVGVVALALIGAPTSPRRTPRAAAARDEVEHVEPAG